MRKTKRVEMCNRPNCSLETLEILTSNIRGWSCVSRSRVIMQALTPIRFIKVCRAEKSYLINSTEDATLVSSQSRCILNRSIQLSNQICSSGYRFFILSLLEKPCICAVNRYLLTDTTNLCWEEILAHWSVTRTFSSIYRYSSTT